MTSIVDLFTDETIIARIKNKLPKLFHIADLESQRAGKIGMEVGITSKAFKRNFPN
jgi:hypothetical protein